MIEFEKKITFVIVSYRSINVIENCIRSINKNIKIIIVENSNDSKLKFYLEKNILMSKFLFLILILDMVRPIILELLKLKLSMHSY